jgi:hypothetical protein
MLADCNLASEFYVTFTERKQLSANSRKSRLSPQSPALEKLTVSQLVKKISSFMQPEILLPFSQ